MIRVLTFLAGLAILTVGTAPAAPSSGSASVVNSFYRWYFSVNGSHGGWTDHFVQARSYFDPSLFALLSKMLTEEQREHAEVLDFDPFVFAQMPATSFTLGTAVASGSTVKIPVTLHFGKSGQTTHLSAIVRQNGGWQIENLVYGSEGNLRSMLEKAVK